MIAVAIDTSQTLGSVALSRSGEVIGCERFGENASHLADIGRKTDALLRSAGLAIGDVDRIAVVNGPGSFTGLRVGLSFAKGIHAACGTEVTTINTLELLALPHLVEWTTVCAMVDARRGEVYAALYQASEKTPPYDSATTVVPPAAVPPPSFLESLPSPPALFVGSGARAYMDTVRSRFPNTPVADAAADFPSTEHLARIAPRLRPLPAEDVRTLEPDYFRASEAQRKLRPIDP